MKRASWLFGFVALLLARHAQADETTAPPLPPPSPVTIQVGGGAAAAPSAEAPASASSTSAASPAIADLPPAAPQPTALRTDLWKISVGPRFSYVTSAGLDPFSKNDVLGQFTLEGLYPVLSRGRFALGVGFAYAGGGLSESMRGDKTGLGVHTLQVPIEGRYHAGRWGFGFARVAPGATAMLASVTDASAPNELSDTAWAFSADVSVGAAILLGPRGWDQADKRTVRIWAVPEVGYTLATTGTFDLRPDRDANDALGTDERTALHGLNLSAFFWRLSVATTF